MLKIFAKLEVYQMSEPRLIDANALDKRFDKRIKWLRLDTHDQYSLGLYHGAVTDKDLINEMPTVDAVPVVHGRWIDAYPDIEPNPMFMYGICSECGFEQGISKYLNYCPNCGAKMDLKVTNDA